MIDDSVAVRSRPGRLLLPTALLLGLAALGCGSLEDAAEELGGRGGASGDPAGSRSGGSGEVTGLPAVRANAAPLYVFLHTHHYLGQGGYYPTAAQVRAVAEAAVEADMAEVSTLFFDGILAQRLKAEDPGFADYVKEHGFAIGYHGEEAHGPYPVVVSVQQLNRGGKAVDQVAEPGWTFDETVNAIQYRYAHGYRETNFDANGYLQRFGNGESNEQAIGGVRLVRQTFGRDVEILPGHAFFQPAAAFAFANETPYSMLQSAGVFAPHFVANTKDKELLESTRQFLGEQTTLFWFMGHLSEKGIDETMLPMWSNEGFATKAGGGKGGSGNKGGSGAFDPSQAPKEGGGQGGGKGGGGGGFDPNRPPKSGGRPAGQGYMGPHLLPWTLPGTDSVRAFFGGLAGILDGAFDGGGADDLDLLQAQGGKSGGSGGSNPFAGKPPRGGGGQGGGGQSGGDQSGGDQSGGKGGSGGDASQFEGKPPKEGAEGGGFGEGGDTEGAFGSGAPGEATKAAAATLPRQVPQLISMKLDGTGAAIADCLAWYKAWARQDDKVVFVTPRTLRDHVQDPEVELSATAVAQAAQHYWDGGPADFLVVDGTHASLAEGWEVMARHLAGEGDRIETSNVIGPIGRATELVNGKGSATGAQVRAAAKVAWEQAKTDKYHAMPTTVTVGGTKVGFHQFYWMMSEAILKGDSASIAAPTAAYAPPFASMLAGKLGRENPNQTFWMETQFWTIKPATWK